VRAAALVLLLASSQAFACGVCVEDKIASTYDHAVIHRALAQKHHVAFFHIDGPLPVNAETKRWLESAIASTAGTDKGTARVAMETLTLSVAYDPKRTSLVALQSTLEKKIAARQLSLLPMRVIDRR
jgi:hypothetical protein